MTQTYFRQDGSPYTLSHASDVLGRPVIEAGRKAGRIRELVAKRGAPYPELVEAVYRKKDRDYFVPVDKFAAGFPDGAEYIPTEAAPQELHSLTDQQFFVRDVLMDKQIVDVQGAKVVRVNDVQLLTTQGRTYLVHVDVGFTGLLRRLGVEGAARGVAKLFGASLRDDIISWRYVQTLEERSGHGLLRLKVDHAALKDLHPGELADILEDLDKDERVALLHSVSAETAAEALEEVEPELGAAIVEDLDPEVAADIMEEIEPSVAADIFEELSEKHQGIIMGKMEEEDRAELTLLKSYEDETAGALMTPDFLSLPDTATVGDALTLIRGKGADVEMMFYLFLTGDEERLTGVVFLRRLILAAPDERLTAITGQRVVSVKLDDPWDDIAAQFYKYNFLALPVVDGEDKMLGVITFKHSFDQLIRFYYKEAV